MTEVFINLIEEPKTFSLESPLMISIQKCTCEEYSKTGDALYVNDARKVMLTYSLRNLENIPPTKNALYQHIRRSVLVAGFMWKRCLQKCQDLPSPKDWIWERYPRLSIWVPYWTDLPDASHD